MSRRKKARKSTSDDEDASAEPLAFASFINAKQKRIRAPKVDDTQTFDFNNRKQRRAAHNAFTRFTPERFGCYKYNPAQIAADMAKYNNLYLVESMNPYFFDNKFVRMHPINKPIIMHRKKALSIRMPLRKKTDVNDVKKLCGGQRKITVVDVESQGSTEWTLEQFVTYYNYPAEQRKKAANVLSLEFSHTKMGKKVQPPSSIDYLDMARVSFPKKILQKGEEMALSLYPKIQKYCLMSVAGSYTDFHIDFGGTSVWYHVLRGHKIFWLIPPTAHNLSIFEAYQKDPAIQDSGFFGDVVDSKECVRIDVRPGTTLILPSGWIHAVYTPKDSIVFGGNFIHEQAITMQLKIFEMEKRAHVEKKMRYPMFYETMWYFAAYLVRQYLCREYVDDDFIDRELHAIENLCLTMGYIPGGDRNGLIANQENSVLNALQTLDYAVIGEPRVVIYNSPRVFNEVKMIEVAPDHWRGYVEVVRFLANDEQAQNSVPNSIGDVNANRLLADCAAVVARMAYWVSRYWLAEYAEGDLKHVDIERFEKKKAYVPRKLTIAEEYKPPENLMKQISKRKQLQGLRAEFDTLDEVAASHSDSSEFSETEPSREFLARRRNHAERRKRWKDKRQRFLDVNKGKEFKEFYEYIQSEFRKMRVGRNKCINDRPKEVLDDSDATYLSTSEPNDEDEQSSLDEFEVTKLMPPDQYQQENCLDCLTELREQPLEAVIETIERVKTFVAAFDKHRNPNESKSSRPMRAASSGNQSILTAIKRKIACVPSGDGIYDAAEADRENLEFVDKDGHSADDDDEDYAIPKKKRSAKTKKVKNENKKLQPQPLVKLVSSNRMPALDRIDQTINDVLQQVVGCKNRMNAESRNQHQNVVIDDQRPSSSNGANMDTRGDSSEELKLNKPIDEVIPLGKQRISTGLLRQTKHTYKSLILKETSEPVAQKLIKVSNERPININPQSEQTNTNDNVNIPPPPVLQRSQLEFRDRPRFNNSRPNFNYDANNPYSLVANKQYRQIQFPKNRGGPSQQQSRHNAQFPSTSIKANYYNRPVYTLCSQSIVGKPPNLQSTNDQIMLLQPQSQYSQKQIYNIQSSSAIERDTFGRKRTLLSQPPASVDKLSRDQAVNEHPYMSHADPHTTRHERFEVYAALPVNRVCASDNVASSVCNAPPSRPVNDVVKMHTQPLSVPLAKPIIVTAHSHFVPPTLIAHKDETTTRNKSTGADEFEFDFMRQSKKTFKYNPN